MLRVVIDPNVVVSAAISPDGVTGRLIRLGLAGQFRMIVCPMLLEEAREVFDRPRFRRFVTLAAALELLVDIEGVAESYPDPAAIEATSRDRSDDYLIALPTSLTPTASCPAMQTSSRWRTLTSAS